MFRTGTCKLLHCGSGQSGLRLSNRQIRSYKRPDVAFLNAVGAARRYHQMQIASFEIRMRNGGCLARMSGTRRPTIGMTVRSANYWAYPTKSDTEPYSAQPPGISAPNASNTANFFKWDAGPFQCYNQ